MTISRMTDGAGGVSTTGGRQQLKDFIKNSDKEVDKFQNENTGKVTTARGLADTGVSTAIGLALESTPAGVIAGVGCAVFEGVEAGTGYPVTKNIVKGTAMEMDRTLDRLEGNKEFVDNAKKHIKRVLDEGEKKNKEWQKRGYRP